MSLLFGIPDWVLSPQDMKNDFGFSQDKLKAMNEYLQNFYSDQQVILREAEKAVLNDALLAASGDIKSKCEAYNTSLEAQNQNSDVILQGRIDCDDLNSIATVFSGEVANYNNIVNKLATVDDVDASFIPVLTELQMDKGIVEGHKKLLRKFLLHVMINGVYIFDFLGIPIRIDLGKYVNSVLSVAAGIIQLISLISMFSGQFNPPFGSYTIPIPTALSQANLTTTCQEMYYLGIKTYNKLHSAYLKKLNEQITEHNSDENVAARTAEYEQIKDQYEQQLKDLVAQIDAEIKKLEAQLGVDLGNISTQQEANDEILVSKVFFFPPGGEQITYSGECYNGIIKELDYLDAYCSGAIDLIKPNTDLIQLYNDFVRNNIVKSYADYIALKTASEDAVIDAETFNSINNNSGMVKISESYTGMFLGTSYLSTTDVYDSGILKNSLDIIFNKTKTDQIKDFFPYYEAYTDINQKAAVDTAIKTFKPYVDTPVYDTLTELSNVIDEIGSDFNPQRTNNYEARVMFSDYNVGFVMARVPIVELAVTPIVSKLETEINDLKSQISVADSEDIPSLQSQLDNVVAIYNVNKEVVNKLERIRLYYEKKPLQYLIDATTFMIDLTNFQLKLGGIITDEFGNQTEAPITDAVIVNMTEVEKLYADDKRTYDNMVDKKIIATEFTKSIKNFSGSEIVTVANGQTVVTSEFESEYFQIDYNITKLGDVDKETQNLIDQSIAENQEQSQLALSNSQTLAIQANEASKNVIYTYSKNAVLKIIKYYMNEEEEINKKLDARRLFITTTIKTLQDQIADLQNQLINNASADVSLIANVQARVDTERATLQEKIIVLQTELDALPVKLDLKSYYMYLICSPIIRLQTQLAEAQAQLNAGQDGFKAFKIPIDPFDELYNGCYHIIKAYMKHLYTYFRGISLLYNFGFPWTTIVRFKPEFLSHSFISISAKNLADDINSGGGGNFFDQLINFFVGNKLKKHLALHLMRFATLKPVTEPIPNPIFWFGLPPFIPPFEVPPTFIPGPGILTTGYIY